MENGFEALAFMLPADEPAEDTAEPEVTAEISYAGPATGWLRLTVSRCLLEPLAEAMVGAMASPEQQHDALGEVANVMCGNLLPLLSGSTAEFRVGTPVVPAPPRNEEPQARARVAFDEGWAQLEWGGRADPEVAM